MLNRLFDRLASVCLLAAIPGGLYAVDGVVLINQNTAVAGGVTPGDAPGFPVTISQSGSYRLSGNLVVPDANTTAIEITAGWVTIDLNGFSIIGPTVCTTTATPGCSPTGTGEGIVARPGARSVRVFNGTVHGMGSNGIDLDIPDNFQAPNFTIGSVENVTADNNGGFGISANAGVFTSVAFQNGSGIESAIVRDSLAYSNLAAGITVLAGTAIGDSAFQNDLSMMGNPGIILGDAAAINNSSVFNGDLGFGAGCPSVVVNNNIQSTIEDVATSDNAPCLVANNSGVNRQ